MKVEQIENLLAQGMVAKISSEPSEKVQGGTALLYSEPNGRAY